MFGLFQNFRMESKQDVESEVGAYSRTELLPFSRIQILFILDHRLSCCILLRYSQFYCDFNKLFEPTIYKTYEVLSNFHFFYSKIGDEIQRNLKE